MTLDKFKKPTSERDKIAIGLFACFLMLVLVIMISVLVVLLPSEPKRLNILSNYWQETRYTKNDTCIDEDLFLKGEIIHLAFVCGGYSSTRGFYVLLKSLLFHRTDPIHLHLFVDNISHKILYELFTNWIVDNFAISYYNMTKQESEIAWIPNTHYSSRYGLMKLQLVSIMLREVEVKKVIILDTDMLVLGDIRHAWNEFKRLPYIKDEPRIPVFGMVENQSGWYVDRSLDRRSSIWPALGQGYNSGTILINLESLRDKLDWQKVWRDETDKQLTTSLTTTLADQDIFNSIIVGRSWLVQTLPCSFNMQLNDRSNLEKICNNKPAKLRILHWNSPRKLETTNPSASQYKSWYISFRNWDGKLLGAKEPAQQSKAMPEYYHHSSSNTRAQEYCYNMRPKLEDKLRVYPYFMDFDYEASEWDVTYVVHLSMDRLQVLHELAHKWQGPISAAIYLPEQESDTLMSFVESSSSLSKRKNIGYHLVFRDRGFNYPINRNRNIALNHTVTPYVFLCDIDFLPSPKLYDYLKLTISTTERNGGLQNKALIVPAFESKEYKLEFPEDKQSLLTKLNLGEVSEFRDRIWAEGHKQTDFNRWKSSSSTYEVKWAKQFEPFIVTRKDVARFDERFIGFGWNKVEHIIQLASSGYKFLVLPEAFVIHKIHAPSFDIMEHRESEYYKKCIQDLKDAFLRELRVKSPKFMEEFYDSSQKDNGGRYRVHSNL